MGLYFSTNIGALIDEAEIDRGAGSCTVGHPCCVPNEKEALLIKPECFVEGPSSGRVYLCQVEGWPTGTRGSCPFITLRGTDSILKGMWLSVNAREVSSQDSYP